MKRYIDIGGLWHAIADNSNQEGLICKWFESGLPGRLNVPRAMREQPNMMVLPGTTDDAHIGFKLEHRQDLSPGLDRVYLWDRYLWLEKTIEIPSNCLDKNIILAFERTYHSSKLWIDGKSLGEDGSCATAHRYNTNGLLTPGAHRITLYINALDVPGFGGHQVIGGNGVKFNGILGYIRLEIEDKLSINSVKCFPNIDSGKVKIVTDYRGNAETIEFAIFEQLSGAMVLQQTQQAPICADYTFSLPNFRAWDEFDPFMYRIEVKITCGADMDASSASFGMVSYASDGIDLRVNGRTIFLRGTHEGCQFPENAAPPMDIASWLNIFDVVKSYGMNHVRCHSWCPPEACFAAADTKGIYLQVEMSGGHNTEVKRILDSFGNHPSFMSMTLGNELFNHNESGEKLDELLMQRWGNNDFANSSSAQSLLLMAKGYDNRHLYSCTTHPIADHPCVDDFYVSAWGRNGMPLVGTVWGGGNVLKNSRFNSAEPNTTFVYTEALEGADKPVISHEVGSWLVYPNLMEIGKYTGTLHNHNYDVLISQLREHYLLDRARDLTECSGKLAVLLYKEEIESALRTKELSGFSLLDLHDYHGQGMATVGILDAFWASKGLIEESRFREFCAPSVVLLCLDKRVYSACEHVTAEVKLANYSSQDIEIKSIVCHIVIGDKTITKSLIPTTKKANLSTLTSVAQLSLCAKDLGIEHACQCEVIIKVNDEITNRWDIWFCEEIKEVAMPKDILVFSEYSAECKQALKSGKKVLLYANSEQLTDARRGCFTSTFWTPQHKPMQHSKTLGYMIENDSKAFKSFPTKKHSDWQWWELAVNSCAFVIDDLSYAVRPLISVIDNFDTNKRLASLVECRIGDARLMISSFDLSKCSTPITMQFAKSLLEYMASDDFAPTAEVDLESLRKTFGERANRNHDYIR